MAGLGYEERAREEAVVPALVGDQSRGRSRRGEAASDRGRDLPADGSAGWADGDGPQVQQGSSATQLRRCARTCDRRDLGGRGLLVRDLPDPGGALPGRGTDGRTPRAAHRPLLNDDARSLDSRGPEGPGGRLSVRVRLCDPVALDLQRNRLVCVRRSSISSLF